METTNKNQLTSKKSRNNTSDKGKAAKPVVFSSRYVVVKRLAEGGTSTIYLARDSLISSAVVIKSIDAKLLQDESTRYIAAREAKVAKQLAHPGLIKVFDLRKHKNIDIFHHGYGRFNPLLIGSRPIC